MKTIHLIAMLTVFFVLCTLEFVQTYVLLGDPALELNLGRTSAAE